MISFDGGVGDGDNFHSRQQDDLVWGGWWMETILMRDNETISFGGGMEIGKNFQTRNLIVSHETRLPKKDSAVHSSEIVLISTL